MAIKWNKNQLKAIEGRNGTMLVSAAAGSGKTAVLVERVIRRLRDGENPCGIENLLIVTFTRAAASQMKEKISSALQKALQEEPGNKRLRRALFMLPYANISTIDSFCVNLVRDNYNVLSISPDFQMLDNSKTEVLKEEAVMSVINDFHTGRKEEFEYLNYLINPGRSDDKLKEIIKNLYTASMAYTFPGDYLESIRKVYDDPGQMLETKWGESALFGAKSYLTETIAKIDSCIEAARSEPGAEKYVDIFSDDKAQLERVLDSIYTKDPEEIQKAMNAASFGRMPTVRNVPEGLKSRCKAVRNYSSSSGSGYFRNQISYLDFSQEEYCGHMQKLAPAVNTLIDAVKEFGKKLRELKDEENAYGFDDVLHFALELLVTNENGAPVKTPYAKQLSENYDEILVDEYQDVSKAQDTVFAAISKDDSNRFMVGDVKQSIYGFRSAMPEVFTDLRKSMTDYDGVNYPARVDLSANYRSRKGITDTANFVFSHLMTERAGGVDYNEREALNPEAEYPESDSPCVEVYLLDKSKESQALFAANYIKNAVENGMPVYDGGETRAARYEDFCILARKSKSFGIYTEIFKNAGVPLTVQASKDLLKTPEVSFVISLLRVIDNPLCDIPLTAVLMSPVYGFTADELSEMRIADRKANIYSCLVKSAADGSEKAERFIKDLERLRRIAVNLPASEFTERIIEETGYRAIVCAMNGGESRLASVEKFLSVAKSYESTGAKGISAFLRYLDSLEKSGKPVEVNPSLTDAADAVTMTTIHKSKGLEYPVVFLCECEGNFNEKDVTENVLQVEGFGLGMKLKENGISYETFPHACLKQEIRRKNRSEEMRLLYVAMTRPKEKLIILAGSNDWGKELSSVAANVTKGENPGPCAVLGLANYSKVLFTALMKHPDAHLLRELAEIDSSVREDCAGRISFEQVISREEEQGAEEEAPACGSDPALLKEISERLSYSYPYSALDGIVAKRIASDFEDEGPDMEYFASDVPAFALSYGLTPAQRGTATHRFMQYADFAAAEKNIDSELDRLVSEKLLTEQEAKAVDKGSIHKFLISSVADRISALPKDKVFREYAFNASLPIREIYPDIPPEEAGDEVIMIEGVTDCAFIENGELVIVDYKTDRAASLAELAVKYSPQLTTYRKCLSQVFGMPVKECLIYSFRFGAQIEVK